MQSGHPNVYGLTCTRCGSPLELPPDPRVVHCDCPQCGQDNVLPQELIAARQPPQVQTRVVIAPVGSIGAVAAELKMQRLVEHRRATLANLLFVTERHVQHISTLAQQDRFAAGVLSAYRLRTLEQEGIRVEWFEDIESKRAFSRATDTLASLRRALDDDSSLRDRSRALMSALEQRQRWRTFFPNDPTPKLAELETAAERSRRDVGRSRLLLIGSILLFPGAVAVFFGGVVMQLITGIELGGPVAVIVTVMLLLGFFGTPILLLTRGSTKRTLERREGEARELRGHVDRYRAFNSDPQGGGLLTQIEQQHPALRGALD